MTNKPETVNSEETVGDVLATFTEEQLNAFEILLECAAGERPKESLDRESIRKTFDTLTDKQKTVVYATIGCLLAENDKAKEEIQNEETSESQ